MAEVRSPGGDTLLFFPYKPDNVAAMFAPAYLIGSYQYRSALESVEPPIPVEP